MTEKLIFGQIDLTTHFPDWVNKDKREGFDGYIVEAEKSGTQ